MTARICSRNGCVREVWKHNTAYCSSVCHFAVSQVDAAEAAVRKNGTVDAVHKWFAAAVILNDTLNEITEHKTGYYNSIGRGDSGKSDAGFQTSDV